VLLLEAWEPGAIEGRRKAIELVEVDFSERLSMTMPSISRAVLKNSGLKQESHACSEVMGEAPKITCKAHASFQVYFPRARNKILHAAVEIIARALMACRFSLAVKLAIKL
jgi:hypothetical protein